MRARWSKSCVLIGYPSGEDPWAYLFLLFFVFCFHYYFICGPILPVQDFLHWSCKKMSAFWPYNKSFIDQASLVMILAIALILFGIFIYLDFISVHKNAMGNGQYPAILTSRLVNNAYHSIHSLSLALPYFPEPSKSTLLCPPPSVRIIQPIYDLDMSGPQKNNKNNQKTVFTNLRLKNLF